MLFARRDRRIGRTGGVAWVLAKGILPISGPRTHEQLVDNLASVDVKLTTEQMQHLDEVSAIKLGFPHDVVAETAPALAGGKLELIDWPRNAVR